MYLIRFIRYSMQIIDKNLIVSMLLVNPDSNILMNLWDICDHQMTNAFPLFYHFT